MYVYIQRSGTAVRTSLLEIVNTIYAKMTPYPTNKMTQLAPTPNRLRKTTNRTSPTKLDATTNPNTNPRFPKHHQHHHYHANQAEPNAHTQPQFRNMVSLKLLCPSCTNKPESRVVSYSNGTWWEYDSPHFVWLQSSTRDRLARMWYITNLPL